METKITQMTYGTCKVCRLNEAVYSRGVCRECQEKKDKFCRTMEDKGLEPGTEEYIEGMKKEGVYY